MVAPRAPKPWMAIFIVPFGIMVIVYLGLCLGWNINRVTQGTGLFIDIIGVITIAIPDIPTFHRYLFSGKLESGLDGLRYENEGSAANEVAAPDLDKRLYDALLVVENAQGCTVDEFLKRTIVQRESPPSSTGFYELREAFREDEDRDKDSWDNVYGFKVFKGQRTIQSIIMREIDGTPKKRSEGPYHMVFGPIENQVDAGKVRIRLVGLALLLIGFLFQLASLFIS